MRRPRTSSTVASSTSSACRVSADSSTTVIDLSLPVADLRRTIAYVLHIEREVIRHHASVHDEASTIVTAWAHPGGLDRTRSWLVRRPLWTPGWSSPLPVRTLRLGAGAGRFGLAA